MRSSILFGSLIALAAAEGAGAAPGSPGPEILAAAPPSGELHAITGTIRAMSPNALVLRLRDGRTLRVDTTQALRDSRTTVLFLSRPVRVYGRFASGIFTASSIQRARDNPETWPADR